MKINLLNIMQSSPRSSPRERGSRSPAYPRQDSTGTLKATISLIPGKNPSVTQTGTFYLIRDTPGTFTSNLKITVISNNIKIILISSVNYWCNRAA